MSFASQVGIAIRFSMKPVDDQSNKGCTRYVAVPDQSNKGCDRYVAVPDQSNKGCDRYVAVPDQSNIGQSSAFGIHIIFPKG